MIRDSRASRYDRQERLIIWDQQLVSTSSVLIAGVGGTGSEVAKNLALLGIGRLILVDQDTVEFSNLNRQMLFGEKDVGDQKVVIAKQEITKRLNPDLKVDIYGQPLQTIPQRVFEEVDIIAGCVDNFIGRQFLNAQAIELYKPYIDSATDGFFGQVQYVKRETSACLACDNPLPPEEFQVLTEPCTLVGIPRIREHCGWKALYDFNTTYQRMPDENSTEEVAWLFERANRYAVEYNFGQFEKMELLQMILFHVPSLVTVNAVISGIQSQEIVKALFLEKKSQLKKNEKSTLERLQKENRYRIPHLTIYSALTGTVNSFDLVPDHDCLVCGSLFTSRKKLAEIRVSRNSLFRSILEEMGHRNHTEYIGFRGNHHIPEDVTLGEVLSDGDRITLSSISNDNELRLKVRFID
ncbi:MAG: ThiF family adenylyltransferase [Candidatus Heimdallarchaeota archaeon]